MAATKTPSYRGSTKHGGGPSAQAEEINEIPDPEARPEEQLSRCLRLPRGQNSPPQSSKTNSRVPPRIRSNLTELKNPLEMSVQTSDFWERSGQSLEALLGAAQKVCWDQGPRPLAVTPLAETVPPS